MVAKCTLLHWRSLSVNVLSSPSGVTSRHYIDGFLIRLRTKANS